MNHSEKEGTTPHDSPYCVTTHMHTMTKIIQILHLRRDRVYLFAYFTLNHIPCVCTHAYLHGCIRHTHNADDSRFFFLVQFLFSERMGCDNTYILGS